MALVDRVHRLLPLDAPVLIRWSRVGLLVSLLMLATAPLIVADTYSVVDHTLSESGGQGVPGAWYLRTGVVLAACSVLVMTWVAERAWGRMATSFLRLYALALLMLVIFPESPWDTYPHDATVAMLHTVAGVAGATSFVIGVLAVSFSRPADQTWARALDWLVVAAVALIPQVMLLTTAQGLLQRVMVALGYVWLFAEWNRIGAWVRSVQDVDRPTLGL